MVPWEMLTFTSFFIEIETYNVLKYIPVLPGITESKYLIQSEISLITISKK